MDIEFYVVKTIENKQVYFTAVPKCWVNEDDTNDNASTLYFPSQANWETLRAKGAQPEIFWRKYACEVRKRGFLTLNEALQEEKKVVRFRDTDDEESYIHKRNEIRKHPTKVIQKISSVDYNSLMNIQGNLQNRRTSNIDSDNDDTISTQYGVTSDSHSDVYDDSSKNIKHVPLGSTSNSSLQLDELENPIIEDITVVDFNLELKEKVDSLRSYVELELVRINVKLDRILKAVGKTQNNSITGIIQDEVAEEIFNLPVSSVQELNEFETKLADKQFFTKVAQTYKNEYVNSRYDGRRVAYLLIEQLIKRPVLTHFSWTGISKHNNKLCFADLENVNKLFYHIVKSADKEYSQINHENFFKNAILKYSEVRAKPKLVGKRTSTPRTSIKKSKRTNLNLDNWEDQATDKELNMIDDEVSGFKNDYE